VAGEMSRGGRLFARECLCVCAPRGQFSPVCQSPDRLSAQAEVRSKRSEVLDSVVGLLNTANDRPALHGEGVFDPCKQTRSHIPVRDFSRRVSVVMSLTPQRVWWQLCQS
jgi:hypothetical protein